MTLLSEDLVCRFIRPDKIYWNIKEKRPKQRAFHDKSGLSIWHEKRLTQHDASFDDLLIDSLSGFGKAHHTIADYFDLAHKSAQKKSPNFSIRINWRPCTVESPWQQWKRAHLEVDISPDPRGANLLLRQWLAINARCPTAPEGF